MAAQSKELPMASPAPTPATNPKTDPKTDPVVSRRTTNPLLELVNRSPRCGSAGSSSGGSSDGPPGRDVLLVEAQPGPARGLLQGLADEGYSIRHLRDGLSTLLALRATPWPAAILLASDLPDVGGLDVCRSLRGFGYRGHVLLMLPSSQAGERVAGLDAGADDVIVKPASLDELSARLRARDRNCSLCRAQQDPRPAAGPGDLQDQPGRRAREAAGENPLTRREQDVLEQMALGLGNAEIAERLFLSHETVKTHVRNLMGKLKARHRTQAVVVALQNGYCLLPEPLISASGRPKRVGWL